MDVRPHIPCCLSATDEDLETEPELFDCETCEVAQRLEDLDDVNADAWAVFRKAWTRFTYEAHLVGSVVAAESAGRTPAAVSDLIARLVVIYDVLYPPPPRKR